MHVRSLCLPPPPPPPPPLLLPSRRWTAQVIANYMNAWGALATWSLPEGSKVVAASGLRKAGQETRSAKVVSEKERFFFFGVGVKFQKWISLFGGFREVEFLHQEDKVFPHASCAKLVQHVGRLSRATCVTWYKGTAQL